MKDKFSEYSRIFEAEKHMGPPIAMTWEKFDVERYLRAFRDAHANAINAYAKDCFGYVYYNTKIGTKLPNLKIDLLGEITEIAPKMGLKVIAYFGTLDPLAVKKHPDWSMKDIEGKSVKWRGPLPFGTPCYNSPYGQYMLDLLAEISENYKIDAVVIDMYGSVATEQRLRGKGQKPATMGCYCKYCQKAYRELYGRDIPTDPDWSDEWKQQVTWRMDYAEKLWQRMVTTLQSRIPGIPVYRNFWAVPSSSWANAQRARFVKGEKYSSFESFGPHGGRCGIISVFARGLTGGKAGNFIVAPGCPVHDPVSPHALKLEILNILTHGGKVQVFAALHYPDGTMDLEFLKMLGECFREMAEKEVYVKGSSSIPYVGILHSDSTRIYYGQDDARNRYGVSLEGAINQFLRLHVPFDVVAEWNITSQGLAPYSIIVIPNVAAMSEEQADAIRDYVKEGGNILATFETSLYDERACKLDNFRLSDIFGLKYLGRSDDLEDFLGSSHSGSYMVCRDHPVLNGLPNTELWMEGHYVKAEAFAGESIAYQKNRVIVDYPEQKVYGMIPGEETDYPAIHLNKYGKGRVIFVTSQLFKRTCSDKWNWPSSQLWLQTLLRGMLDWLNLDPPVWVEAPITVEATFFKNVEKKQIIVQTVNKTNIDVEIPLRNIEIRINKKIRVKEAYNPWPKKKRFTVIDEETYSKIVIPELKTHKIIVLQL